MFRYLQDSFRFLGNHLASFILIILPPVLIVQFLTVAIRQYATAGGASEVGSAASFVVELLASPFYEAAAVFFIASTIKGKSLSVGECWRLGLEYWPKFLLLYVLLSLAVAVGFAFFVLPGVFVLSRFAFAEFELLLEGRATVDALKISWSATESHAWTLFQGFSLLLLLVFGPMLFVSAIEVESVALDVATGVVQALFGVLLTIFAFRIYYESTVRSKTRSAVS